MSVDERSRLQLAEAAKRLLGADEGITLMELLPPVGWADVATKHDLLQLEERLGLRFERSDARFDVLEAQFDARLEIFEHRLDARFEKGFRQIVVTMMSLYVTGLLGVALVLALR